MIIKINGMEIEITRQENFPEEIFTRFIQIMEHSLQGKPNVRTAKEIKEVIERIILNKFPLEESLEETIEYYKTDEVEGTFEILGMTLVSEKRTSEQKIKFDAEFISEIIEDCLVDNGAFLMWWNRTGEYKDSETAKFTGGVATLSEEDEGEYNFGW